MLEVLESKDLNDFVTIVKVAGDTPNEIMSQQAKDMAAEVALKKGWDPRHIAVTVADTYYESKLKKQIREFKIEP